MVVTFSPSFSQILWECMQTSVDFQEFADSSQHPRFPIVMHDKQERQNDHLNFLLIVPINKRTNTFLKKNLSAYFRQTLCWLKRLKQPVRLAGPR